MRFIGASGSGCRYGVFNAAHQNKSFATTMIEQLGLIGTILDEEQSPEEPDTESEPEVGPRFGSVPEPEPKMCSCLYSPFQNSRKQTCSSCRKEQICNVNVEYLGLFSTLGLERNE